jgi:alkaline phosphatase
MSRKLIRDERSSRQTTTGRRKVLLSGAVLLAIATAVPTTSLVQQQPQQQPAPATTTERRPNILVFFGDDIGLTNVSAFSTGVMGYHHGQKCRSLMRLARHQASCVPDPGLCRKD